MFWKKKSEVSTNPSDDQAFLVAWRTKDSGLAINLNPKRIESPGTAGLILADLYRHFARALAQTGLAISEEHAKAEMIAMFLSELKHPTDEGSGTISRN